MIETSSEAGSSSNGAVKLFSASQTFIHVKKIQIKRSKLETLTRGRRINLSPPMQEKKQKLKIIIQGEKILSENLRSR